MRFLGAVAVLILGACGSAAPDRIAFQPEISTFYLVNRSGRDVRLSVTVDGHELFIQEIKATREPPTAVPEAPPPSPWPTRQLKVALRPDARRLVVEESVSGMRATTDVLQQVRSNWGFRITIYENSISIARDYLPVR
jgi:hypothetical protein